MLTPPECVSTSNFLYSHRGTFTPTESNSIIFTSLPVYFQVSRGHHWGGIGCPFDGICIEPSYVFAEAHHPGRDHHRTSLNYACARGFVLVITIYGCPGSPKQYHIIMDNGVAWTQNLDGSVVPGGPRSRADTIFFSPGQDSYSNILSSNAHDDNNTLRQVRLV